MTFPTWFLFLLTILVVLGVLALVGVNIDLDAR